MHVTGKHPLTIKLILQLKDPWMLIQLGFLRDVHAVVLRPCFVLARKHESGGGAQFILKYIFFCMQLLETLEPEEMPSFKE